MNYNKINLFIIGLFILIPVLLFGQENFDKKRIYPIPVGDKAGYIDYRGQIVIPPKYYHTRAFDPDNRAAIVSTGIKDSIKRKDGIIDLQGNILVPIIYHSLKRIETIKDAYGDLYLASIDKKYGVINLENQIIIPLEYDYVTPETDYFIVKKEGKVGVLNLLNEVVLSLEYDKIHQHTWAYDGFLVKGANGKWALYEEDGKQLCDPIFDDRNIEFTPSYINGSSNGKPLTIDYYGMVHPDLDFKLQDFYENKYSVAETKEGLFGLINDNFNWVIQPQYESLMFNEYQLVLFKEAGKWGAMTLSGDILLEPKYKGILQVSETIFGLSVDDTGYRMFDLVNKNWLKTQKYYDIDGYDEFGIIGVNINPDPFADGTWGLLDFQGEVLSEPANYGYFDEEDAFYMYGPEDRNASGIYSPKERKILIPPIFDLVYYKRNTLIKVYYWVEDENDKVAYLNHQGAVIWAEPGFEVEQLIEDFYTKNPQYAK